MRRGTSYAASAAGSLETLALSHGFGPESAVTGKLTAYLRLLTKWNARINLTADTGWEGIGWLFAEAFWAARWYPQTPVRHLDIGSGAGFPAVPLKILRPSMRLQLVESRAKRAAFLETAAAELDLPEVRVASCRAEDYLREADTDPYDIVSWKGIRLSRAALTCLAGRSGPDTRCWLFHGRELPLADPAAAAEFLRLLKREAFPGHPQRWLSIFAVSRETCAT